MPPSVNLGPAGPAGAYSNATVHLGFQRFSAIGTERVGQPIVYAVTIPGSAPHRAEAREFADALVRAAGEGRTGWPAPLAQVTVPLGRG